jgi:dihydroorotase
MPLMLTQVQAGRMTLNDYVRMTSTAPARAFGLFPRKGALIPGADADIVVIDLDREEIVDSGMLQSKGPSTPFDQAKVKGVPIHTLVRGRFVMRDRALVTEAKGHGLSVRRIQQMDTPAPQHLDQTTAAILAAKPGA